MPDRIDFGGKPWTALPREVLRDSRLSPRAKGGLVTLLSHDEGYIRSCIAILMHENDCGRDQARGIMRELVGAGYAELHAGKGQFKASYTVRPTPRNQQESTPEPTGSQGTGSQGVVNQGAGSPLTVVEPKDVEPTEEEPIEVQHLGAQARDAGAEQAQLLTVDAVATVRRQRQPNPLWDAVMEVCHIDVVPDSARGKYNVAVAQLRNIGATPDDVRLRAAIYRVTFSTQLTPNALVSQWGVCNPDALQGVAQQTYDGRQMRSPVAMANAKLHAEAEVMRQQEALELAEREERMERYSLGS